LGKVKIFVAGVLALGESGFKKSCVARKFLIIFDSPRTTNFKIPIKPQLSSIEMNQIQKKKFHIEINVIKLQPRVS
jgi:hypothetical protein